jgi:alpha-tubulin suppressor-like RCC1 family protein
MADIGLQENYNHRVAAGWRHSLAVLENGRVMAWPASYDGNQYGQLDVPEDLSDVVAVGAGERYSLALRSNGEIAVWGELKDPEETTGFTAISAGRQHALALREDGTVYAWGSNIYGQLEVPANLRNVVLISAGGRHSLAITTSGEVVAWGDNAFGQCNVPVEAKDVVQVAAGWGHSLALTREGQVLAWGADTHRQIQVPKNIQGYVHTIASGWWRSYAILRDGTLSAWGGHDSPNPNLQIQLLPDFLRPSMGLSAGEGHAMAVNLDGTVQSWGHFSSTGMAHGLAPTGLKVVGESQYSILGPAVTNPKLLEIGGTYVVLRSDGTVVAWGQPQNANVPEGLSDVVDITGHDTRVNYVMAVTRGGQVVAWGRSVNLPWNVTIPLSPSPETPIMPGQLELRIAIPEELPPVTAVAGGSRVPSPSQKRAP